MAALAALSLLMRSALVDAATFPFDIAREDLSLALNQVARQSHIEIAYSAELTRGKISPPLKGTYTPEQALKFLLKGSGLRVRRIAGGALVIEKERARNSPSPELGATPQTAVDDIHQHSAADPITTFARDQGDMSMDS